jgi:WD40 repeat protein
VFLDDASMSANTGLWSNIEKGLTEAEWFILLCSPKAAASQYVTNEITWWLEHKSSDRILLVLDEGEILWDAKAGDFDWARASAVNRALSKAFAEEPRWVDLSWFEQEASLRTADPRFNERVADLAAAVRGMERDELVGENVQQRRRALRLLRGGVIALSGLLIASLAATAIAVVNGNAAAEQARIAQARQLAAQAIVASSTDLQLASLLAVEAVRLHDDSQTEAALFQLQNTSPHLARSLQVGAYVRATAISTDGTVLTGDDDGIVSSWQGSKRTDLIQMPGRVQGVATSADHSVVAAASSDPAGFAVVVGSALYQPDFSDTSLATDGPVHVAVSPDGHYVAVGGAADTTLLFENTGSDLVRVGQSELAGRMAYGDGSLTIFNGGPALWQRLNAADGAIVTQGSVPLSRVVTVAVSGDGQIIAGTTERGIDYNGWLTSRPTTIDSPADRVATSSIAGALDNALDDDGSRFATQVEGAIYVSQMRDPAEAPEAPLALDGSGAVNFESMSFVGDTIVSGSGDDALVWDLDAVGRVTTAYPTPVPEGCSACGTQVIHVNDSATRLVMTDQSAFSTVVVDLTDGRTQTLSGYEDFGRYAGASWFDDDRIIVSSPADQALLVLSGDDYSTVDLAIPITLGENAKVLTIRSDGKRVAVLDSDGLTQVIDIASGRVVSSSTAFADAFVGAAAGGFGIAGDLSTAYVWWLDGPALYVDLSDGHVIYQADKSDGMAYDGDSRLHVFSQGAENVVDPETGALSAARPAKLEALTQPGLSSNGDLVVEGDTTGVVTLLDLASRGSVLGRIPVPVQDTKHVISAFSSDDTRLVMTLQEMDLDHAPSSVRIVDLTVAGWKRASCAVAGRDLTPAEWEIYLGTTPPTDLRCDR